MTNPEETAGRVGVLEAKVSEHERRLNEGRDTMDRLEEKLDKGFGRITGWLIAGMGSLMLAMLAALFDIWSHAARGG